MAEHYTPVYEEKLIEKMFSKLWDELCVYRDKYEALEEYERNRGSEKRAA